MISFNNTVAKVLAVVPLSAKASTHFVNMSVTTSMYLLPCDEISSGPIISHDNISKGAVAWRVPKGAGGLGCGGFLF